MQEGKNEKQNAKVKTTEQESHGKNNQQNCIENRAYIYYITPGPQQREEQPQVEVP